MRRRAANLTLDEVRECVLELMREGASPSEIEIRRRLGGAPSTVLALRRTVFNELIAAVEGTEPGPNDEPNPLEMNARELWQRAESIAAEKWKADRQAAENAVKDAHERFDEAANELRLLNEQHAAVCAERAEYGLAAEAQIAELHSQLANRTDRLLRIERILTRCLRHHGRQRARWRRVVVDLQRDQSDLQSQRSVLLAEIRRQADSRDREVASAKERDVAAAEALTVAHKLLSQLNDDLRAKEAAREHAVNQNETLIAERDMALDAAARMEARIERLQAERDAAVATARQDAQARATQAEHHAGDLARFTDAIGALAGEVKQLAALAIPNAGDPKK